MSHQFLGMSKAKLYLALADDDTVQSWVRTDMSKYAGSRLRVRSGDPEVDNMTSQEVDVWSSAQRWLDQKKQILKRIICDEWKYCSRRAEYGDDYERLIWDVAGQIRGVVDEHLAELVATIMFKESLFTFCECGDTKRLMQEAVEVFEEEQYDDYVFGLFSHIVEIDPDNHRAHYYQGAIRLEQQRYEEAILHYQKAMSLSPADPAYLNDLGYIYAYVRNNLEVAQDYVSLALKMLIDDPNNLPRCLDSLGWILYQQGQYAEALKYVSESLVLMRKDIKTFGVRTLQEILYHASEIYRVIGDVENLQKTREEILQLDTESIWAKKIKNGIECLSEDKD